MFLQSYLYYCCAAVFHAKETKLRSALVSGVEQIHKYCVSWQKFFYPVMLETVRQDGLANRKVALESVGKTNACIECLKNRCQAVMTAYRSGADYLFEWELDTLTHFIEKHALPLFRSIGYNSFTDCKAVYFDLTDQYLTSLVPLEVSKTTQCIPAAYNTEEQLVIQLYLQALRNAPSLAAISGVEREEMPKYIWADGKFAISQADNSWVPALVQADNSNLEKIYLRIFDSWCFETVNPR